MCGTEFSNTGQSGHRTRSETAGASTATLYETSRACGASRMPTSQGYDHAMCAPWVSM